MSIESDGFSNDRLYRTSAPPGFSTSTFCCWARREATGTDWRMIMALEDATTDATNQIYLGISNGGSLVCSGTAFSKLPAVGSWFFAAMTCAGSGSNQNVGYILEVNDTTFTTATATITSFTPAMMSFCGDSYINESWPGQICAYKVWNRVLSENELYNEVWSIFPKSVSSLIYFNPGFNITDVTRDWTGNANMTINGTLATSSLAPPIGWGLTKGRIYLQSSGGGGGGISSPIPRLMMG